MLPRRSLRHKINTMDEKTSEDDGKDTEFVPPVKKMRSKQIGSEKKIIAVQSEQDEVNKNESVKEIDDEKEQSLQTAESIYEFSAKDIKGKMVSMNDYKGHVCIIVNVASRCGHTKSNYEQLVEIFNQYSKSKGLKILAFPCNQFGKQEPGDSNKICDFIKKKNVEFDVFEKIEVNGKNAHPLWKFLKSKIAGPKGNNIDWNFTKFIVNKDGQVVERHKPSVKPLQMVGFLEKYW